MKTTNVIKAKKYLISNDQLLKVIKQSHFRYTGIKHAMFTQNESIKSKYNPIFKHNKILN